MLITDQWDHVPVDAPNHQLRSIRWAVATAETARSAAAEAFHVVAAVNKICIMTGISTTNIIFKHFFLNIDLTFSF